MYGSIAEAQQAVGRPLVLPRPDDPLASDDQISDVLILRGGGGPAVRIDYAQCIYVQIHLAPSFMTVSKAEAAKVYRREAAGDALSTNGQAAAIEVQGVPAYLIPTDSAIFANGESQHAGGSIELIVDGRSVDIVGRVSNEEFIRLAASVVRRATWPSSSA